LLQALAKLETVGQLDPGHFQDQQLGLSLRVTSCLGTHSARGRAVKAIADFSIEFLEHDAMLPDDFPRIGKYQCSDLVLACQRQLHAIAQRRSPSIALVGAEDLLSGTELSGKNPLIKPT
jgi:hypothetical protein